VEHSQRRCGALGHPLDASLTQHVCCLLCIHFKRLNPFSEIVDFLENALKLAFKSALERLKSYLLRQLLLGESVQGVEAKLE